MDVGKEKVLITQGTQKTKWVILFGSFVWAHPEPYRLAEASSKKVDERANSVEIFTLVQVAT